MIRYSSMRNRTDHGYDREINRHIKQLGMLQGKCGRKNQSMFVSPEFRAAHQTTFKQLRSGYAD